jgi:hypothetical protein
LQSFVDPLQNAVAGRLQIARDLAHLVTGIITPKNLRPLDIAESGGLGLSKLIEVHPLFIGKDQPWARG